MNRELYDHKVPGTMNNDLAIVVLDEPGQGNACHKYAICTPHDSFNQELNAGMVQHLVFQNGPLKEVGINGITNEALLAVVIDRLRGFQSGQFACRENALALTDLESSLMWLQKRTRDRLSRGVEGTNVK